MSNHQNYYITNKVYSENLDKQEGITFRKYARKVESLLKSKDSFLDVGCGTGLALQQINNKRAYGVDISKTSIKKCIKKGLSCQVYDGQKLPYNNSSFRVVGCYDVLEHVDAPVLFLKDMLRVVKTSGYLVIVCPNFLSITNRYHYHTKGFIRKLLNLLLIVVKIVSKKYKFSKMATIEREDFHPDDDACNVTNPLDILKWAKKQDLRLVYWSGRSIDTGNANLNKILDRYPFKVFLGSSFLIFRKP